MPSLDNIIFEYFKFINQLNIKTNKSVLIFLTTLGKEKNLINFVIVPTVKFQERAL